MDQVCLYLASMACFHEFYCIPLYTWPIIAHQQNVSIQLLSPVCSPHSPQSTSFNISLDSFGPRYHSGSRSYSFLNRPPLCRKYRVASLLSLYLPSCFYDRASLPKYLIKGVLQSSFVNTAQLSSRSMASWQVSHWLWIWSTFLLILGQQKSTLCSLRYKLISLQNP